MQLHSCLHVDGETNRIGDVATGYLEGYVNVYEKSLIEANIMLQTDIVEYLTSSIILG